MTKFDWQNVDWTMRDCDIARILGCTRQAVHLRRMHLGFKGSVSGRTGHAPEGVELGATIKETSEKYGVGWNRAYIWHQLACQPHGRRGPKLVPLPPGFTPVMVRGLPQPHQTSLKYQVSSKLAERWIQEWLENSLNPKTK